MTFMMMLSVIVLPKLLMLLSSDLWQQLELATEPGADLQDTACRLVLEMAC